ncbi:MAG: type transport system ATP-binding protein [Phycisphaerales bacterium]|jgi:ABC-2 type transport system ATP-binding protein|nr:type transport system ATP-binding protein [Phycisphaerales bacterium]
MSDAITPLQLQGVKKHFGVTTALAGVDWSVPAGSVVGLLGQNAAGKTTLIKTALGLLRPSRGEAKIFGGPSWDMPAATKARIGYVPQVITLYPWMRVRQLINYTASFYPTWNDALASKLAMNWAIPREDKVGNLSVGTLQKLAIVLALGHEPELLLLDEPAASLDPGARREFLRTILEIAVDGRRTILFSTHITSDLERVADRVAILREGRIVYDGELDTLKDSVKRLHVTSPTPLPANFQVPGAVRLKIEGNEALVSVRDVSERLVDDIRRNYAATVGVQDLNLEDIFLELHHA